MRFHKASRLLIRSYQHCKPCDFTVRWLSSSLPHQCSCSVPSDSPILSAALPATGKAPPIPPADHRTLGTKESLFTTTSFSPGSPLFYPAGTHVFLKLQAFLRAQYRVFGIREVITPTIYKNSLWHTSGHWENYAENMFAVRGQGASKAGNSRVVDHTSEDEGYALKPMNCPGHCLLFKAEARSYRDLPIRYADFSPLHRNEISGTLSGLTRVRRFHQDDAHIFCRPSQVEEEIASTLRLVALVYKTFQLGPYKLVLSTRPTLFLGKADAWDRAEGQLRAALEASGHEWTINEGDGAFYGPKIDIILQDSDGKEHQTATIQLDFQLPLRFGLEYMAPAPESEVKGLVNENEFDMAQFGKVTPVIIHRAVMGSLERFMALLIEHYNGKWPFWLSPRQVMIATVGNDPRTLDFARAAARELSGISNNDANAQQPLPLEGYHFEVDLDLSDRTVGKKVRDARTSHYNLIGIVGPEEVRQGRISVDTTGGREPLKTRTLCAEMSGQQDAKPSQIPMQLEELHFAMQKMSSIFM